MRAALWVLRPIPRTERARDLRQRATPRLQHAAETGGRTTNPDNVLEWQRNVGHSSTGTPAVPASRLASLTIFLRRQAIPVLGPALMTS